MMDFSLDRVDWLGIGERHAVDIVDRLLADEKKLMTAKGKRMLKKAQADLDHVRYLRAKEATNER